MDYHRRIIELLKENLTERSFKLWRGIDRLMPNCWDKLTSTTKKYHRKANGEVPSQGEHVFEMLHAAVKILSMFGYDPKTTDTDKILLAIALHDSMKYGNFGTRKHTDNRHDKFAADMVSSNKHNFTKVLTEEQFFVLEEAVRFHSGRWSTDARHKEFNWKDYNPETLVVHVLDMLSSKDCLKTNVEE